MVILYSTEHVIVVVSSVHKGLKLDYRCHSGVFIKKYGFQKHHSGVFMQRAKIKMHKGFWTVYNGHLDRFPDRRHSYPVLSFLGWNSITGWDYRDLIIEWLDTTIGASWIWSWDKLWFIKEQDAVLFLLRWGEDGKYN